MPSTLSAQAIVAKSFDEANQSLELSVLSATATAYGYISKEAITTIFTPTTENLFPGTAYADIDGDGYVDVLLSGRLAGNVTARVIWLRQTPPGSLGAVNIIATEYPVGTLLADPIETVAAADFDADGKVEVIFMNQTTGDIFLAKQNTADPTGAWTTVRLFAARSIGAQMYQVYDADGDGRLEIVYAYEGFKGGAGPGLGGVAALRYTGNDVTAAASWTDTRLGTLEGCWGMAQGLLEGTDLVVTSRASNNTAAPKGVYIFRRPALANIWTETWSREMVDDRVGVWAHVGLGNFFDDGHNYDIVAGDQNQEDGSAPLYSVTLYRKNDSWARTQLTDPDPTHRHHLFFPIRLTEQRQHDIILGTGRISGSTTGGLYLLRPTGPGAYTSELIHTYADMKPEDVPYFGDFDRDGSQELVFVSQLQPFVAKVDWSPGGPTNYSIQAILQRCFDDSTETIRAVMV